tara:strand:- start:575 stop:1321 length:747 start_codon:yes stop_codon:yes gene_type:complete
MQQVDVQSTPRLVGFPWYDSSKTMDLWSGFWVVMHQMLLSRGIQNLPFELDRKTDPRDQWSHPQLLLSQCCGLDLHYHDMDHIVPVARPAIPELQCEPGDYYSYVIVRGDVKNSGRIVVNNERSRSGCTSLLEWLRNRGLRPELTLVSGSHQESIRYIKQGVADIAAIDAYSANFLDMTELKIVGTTRPTAAPPFITRLDIDIPRELLIEALEEAVRVKGASLGIAEVIPTERDAYSDLQADWQNGSR